MSATIKMFKVGEKNFTHSMNGDHDSVELRDEHNEVLLTYGTDARVSNKDGRIGNFTVEYIDGFPCWVFYEMPLETRSVYGPDLITAEVELSKRFITGFQAGSSGLGALAFA